MIFDEIKTERDVGKLKKRILKNSDLKNRMIKIRDDMKFRPNLSAIQASGDVPLPNNAELLFLYNEMVKDGVQQKISNVEKLLRKIKTKSNSGVAVVSLLTKPFACPGRCTYCPTEKNMPKSYLSKEPAAARALLNGFDPYRQVSMRLRALMLNGHQIDKIEIIVIGGTWSFYHKVYQEEFISECFRACNNFSRKKENEILLEEKNFLELQKINETAKNRIIGLSIETRPDYINLKEIERLRYLGVTKVEIGVQHLDDKISEITKRDMTSEDVINATEMLRQNGFKVVYHMMPNLPGSNIKRDIEMFGELFSGKKYQPDMLKIYPCMVLEGSELHEIWQNGGFKAYTDEELLKVLVEAKKQIPSYVRILRVIRDIPATYIKEGSKISNLRQSLDKDMVNNNWQCKCIRCREIRDDDLDLEDFDLGKIEYETTDGREIFLSFEHKRFNKLASFLRLRLPNKKENTNQLACLKGHALIRELHTYGRLTPLSKKGEHGQHIGFGKRLLVEAEKIAKENGYKIISIISGVGVRDYYRKRGYRLNNTYMVKTIV